VCDDCGEGFRKDRDNCMCGMSFPPLVEWHRYAMHRFIDYLADGKTIDEALQALSQQEV